MLQSAIRVENFRSSYPCIRVGIEKALQFGYYRRRIGYVGIQYEAVPCVTVGGAQCNIVRATVAQIAISEAIRNVLVAKTIHLHADVRIVDNAEMGLQLIGRRRHEKLTDCVFYLAWRCVMEDDRAYDIVGSAREAQPLCPAVSVMRGAT